MPIIKMTNVLEARLMFDCSLKREKAGSGEAEAAMPFPKLPR
jgi:hypothetical protein